MSVSTMTIPTDAGAGLPWLRSRRWDLLFVSLSVVLVAAPYAIYLLLLNLGTGLQPLAGALGADVEGISRNAVNLGVALLVGGPHMYVTLTRTALDHDFSTRHRRYLWSALIVPVVVIALAFLNLTLLLTVFFFWASIHVLYQIIYITELHNEKQTTNLTLVSRLVDYGVILTALYPLAAWKIVQGTFMIGPNNLGEMIGQFLPVGPWMVWLVGGAFAVALVAWIAKSVIERRQGKLHGPKTLFIALTVTASFLVPTLGNLDTAFQGMNVWHSFQYLALTWLLIHLRQQRGQLENSPFVDGLAKTGASRRYYGFAVGMTLATVLLAAGLFALFRFAMGQPFDLAFDRAYYISVLGFLWVHYYFDHYLFSKPGVIRA
jgi:hypothetical protein